MIKSQWPRALRIMNDYHKEHSQSIRGIGGHIKGYSEVFGMSVWMNVNESHTITIERKMMGGSATITLKKKFNGKDEKEFSIETTEETIADTLEGMMSLFF